MITQYAAMTAALGVLAGQPGQPVPPAAHRPTLEQIAGLDPKSREQGDALMLEIAREYNSYRRVSDAANWAPTLCRTPPPVGVQGSTSDDDDTHGRKLYFLFARDSGDYGRLHFVAIDDDSEPKPPYRAAVGQVIVKESFVPVEVKPENVPAPAARPKDPAALPTPPRELPEDHTRDDRGRIFRNGDPAGLFIMAKIAPDEAEGTDHGWVYATVSPDLKSVTAFGRIASCMECHAATKHDRLFGPKWLQRHDAAAKAQAEPPKR